VRTVDLLDLSSTLSKRFHFPPLTMQYTIFLTQKFKLHMADSMYHFSLLYVAIHIRTPLNGMMINELLIGNMEESGSNLIDL
jgi:hypothetical protein